jgi:hypothetical protein
VPPGTRALVRANGGFLAIAWHTATHGRAETASRIAPDVFRAYRRYTGLHAG